MGRKSGVSYWHARRQYITSINGRRHVLVRDVDDDRPSGPEYARALAIFNAIQEVESDPSRYDTTLEGCVKRWLAWVKDHQAKQTHRMSASAVGKVLATIGKVDIANLNSQHLEDAINVVPGWGATTRCHAWDRVRRALTWNVERKHIRTHPLIGVKTPEGFRKGARGPECYLPGELLDLMVSRAAGRFRDFLTALRVTGARPGEIANAERLHYRQQPPHLYFDANPPAGTYRWKNAGRKKVGAAYRRVFLSPEVVALAERNQQRGRWLFPHDDGRWTGERIQKAFSRLRRDAKIVEWLQDHPFPVRRIIPYSLRHTFITNFVMAGKSIKLIADLCGTSTVMIEKHYSHVLSQPDELYRVFLSVR